MSDQNSQEFSKITKSITNLVNINKQQTKEQKAMREELAKFKEEVNT